MICRYRRYWSLTAVLLLALPLFVGIVRPDTETMSSDELRDVAKAPQLPDGVVGWRELPAQLDAYLHDHFGLRKLLIHWEAFLIF